MPLTNYDYESKITAAENGITGNASVIAANQSTVEALTFRDLNDTPSGYSNLAGQSIQVSGDESELVASYIEGHFETNFSVNQKEDLESSIGDNQLDFNMIPFGTEFDNVDQDKTLLHTVETVLVPAHSSEITWSGTWDDSGAGTDHKFGRVKYSETGTPSNTYAEFSFSGVSCFLALFIDSPGILLSMRAELSDDGGSTWHSMKKISTDGGDLYNRVWELYSGLPYGDYKVRVSKNVGRPWISYFGYTTYMIQRSVSQYYSTTSKDIDDVPPMTCLIDDNWYVENYRGVGNESWNGAVRLQADDDPGGATVEFKFFGSKVWSLQSWVGAGIGDVDVSVYIDDAQTKVNFPTYNTNAVGGVHVSAWTRLDDGTLDEGWHTVKLTAPTIGSSQVWIFSGFGFYSGDQSTDTTVKRSLICGKDSYAVGVDELGVWKWNGVLDDDDNGGWTGNSNDRISFLGRRNYTNTNTDYAEIDTPDNSELKAIYLIASVSTGASVIHTTLGGGNSRYLERQTNNYDQQCFVYNLYDKALDGNLHNQALRIIHESGSFMVIEGVVFEIGDPVENGYIRCMPKWSRYNSSSYSPTPISVTQRLDVYGRKTDPREGRKPVIHTGWVWNNGGTVYFRHGCGVGAYEASARQSISTYPSDYVAEPGRVHEDYAVNNHITSNYDPGLGSLTNMFCVPSSADWIKGYIDLPRVI